jgi:WD40 repeat protein
VLPRIADEKPDASLSATMSFRSLSIAACSLAFAWSSLLPADQPGPDQKAGPRHDQYGDPLPKHALLRIGTTRLRPNVANRGWLLAMAFTRDGKRLVTMNDWAGAQVWDAATGTKLLAFGKPASFGRVVYALSPDGSRAAIIESKKACRFYDTASGKLIGSAAGDWGGVDDLRFSPNNKFLGVSRRETVAVWDVASGLKSWHIPLPKESRFGAFAFASDEKMVMFAPRASSKPADDPERPLPLLLFDVAKGPKSERACPIELASARGLAFSPDGKILATEADSREFVLWDFTTGKLLHQPRTQDDMVWCRCFSPNGKWIVTGSNHGRVRLWDVATGKLKRKFSGFDDTIHSLAFSPDSKRVAASGQDGTIRVWHVDSGKEAFDFEGHRMRNVQARFSSDGKTIVSICGFNPTPKRTADERTYRFWDATTGKPLRRIELGRKEFLPFCLSGDARMLFVIDGKITKRDLATGKVENVLGLPTDYYAYRCSADGRYLAAHTDDFWAKDEEELVASNLLKVVDTTTGKEVLAHEGSKGEMFHCRFTETACCLAVHSFRYETDGSMGKRSGMALKETFLTIWDLKTGRKKLFPGAWKGSFRWPGGVGLSPSMDLALTRGKDGVELRELASNKRLAQLPASYWESESGAFSPDGKFMAVGNEKGQILLWSVHPPKPLVTLTGHTAAVTSVHFSPDGKRLVSGSDDTTILVWDVFKWTAPAAKP